MFTGSEDHKIDIFDVRSAAQVASLSVHQGWVLGVRVSPAGACTTCSTDGIMKLSDAEGTSKSSARSKMRMVDTFGESASLIMELFSRQLERMPCFKSSDISCLAENPLNQVDCFLHILCIESLNNFFRTTIESIKRQVSYSFDLSIRIVNYDVRLIHQEGKYRRM